MKCLQIDFEISNFWENKIEIKLFVAKLNRAYLR